MRVSVRLVLGLAAAVAALALFLWLADFVEDKAAVPFDASVRGWVHAHSNPTLTSFMRLMSLIGSPAFLVAFSLIAFLILLRVAHWPREALLFLVAMTGGFVLDGVLKVVFHRARPPPAISARPDPPLTASRAATPCSRFASGARSRFSLGSASTARRRAPPSSRAPFCSPA